MGPKNKIKFSSVKVWIILTSDNDTTKRKLTIPTYYILCIYNMSINKHNHVLLK